MQRDYSKIIAKINRQIGSDANNLSKVQNLIETFKQDFTDTALKVNEQLGVNKYRFVFNFYSKPFNSCR